MTPTAEDRFTWSADLVVWDDERADPGQAEGRAWDEAAHPRVPAGEGGGGQFMSYDESKNTGTGYGKKGGDADVRKLQEALNRLGLTDSKGRKLEVDGMLGPLTTAAVKKAQQLLGVKADGKVSPAMLKKILAMKKPKAGVKAQHDDKDDKPKPKQYHKAGTTQAQHDGKDEKPKPKAKPKQYHKAGVTQAEQQIYHQDTKRSAWNEADHPRGPRGRFAETGMSLNATDHGLTIVDPEFTGTTGDDAWLASTDVPTRAAELWANRFEDMQAIRSAVRGERIGPYKSKQIRDWDDTVIYGPQDRVKDARVAAAYLREQISKAGPVDYPLHRGMGVSGDALQALTTPGSEFDSDVISWTDRPDLAGNYARRHAESEGGIPVVLTLIKGAHAFNLDDILTGKTKGGGEHLTGGRYRVVSSVRNAAGGWDVVVEEAERA